MLNFHQTNISLESINDKSKQWLLNRKDDIVKEIQFSHNEVPIITHLAMNNIPLLRNFHYEFLRINSNVYDRLVAGPFSCYSVIQLTENPDIRGNYIVIILSK